MTRRAQLLVLVLVSAIIGWTSAAYEHEEFAYGMAAGLVAARLIIRFSRR